MFYFKTILVLFLLFNFSFSFAQNSVAILEPHNRNNSTITTPFTHYFYCDRNIVITSISFYTSNSPTGFAHIFINGQFFATASLPGTAGTVFFTSTSTFNDYSCTGQLVDLTISTSSLNRLSTGTFLFDGFSTSTLFLSQPIYAYASTSFASYSTNYPLYSYTFYYKNSITTSSSTMSSSTLSVYDINTHFMLAVIIFYLMLITLPLVFSLARKNKKYD